MANSLVTVISAIMRASAVYGRFKYRRQIKAAREALVAAGRLPAEGASAHVDVELHHALALVRSILRAQARRQSKRRNILAMPNESMKRLREQMEGKVPLDHSFVRYGAKTRLSWLDPTERPKPPMLEMAPFPKLTLRVQWDGVDVLASWKGFQSRGGYYTSRDSEAPSTGEVRVFVMQPPGDVVDTPPCEEQVAAYQYLKEHEPEVTGAVLRGVLEYYGSLRPDYVSPGEDDAHMPAISTTDQLRPLMGLGLVHVHDLAKERIAYIGFECGCTWDPEHGVGIMMHKDRVVSVGQGDTAFLDWVAEKDGAVRVAAPAGRMGREGG
jgi:hypothetical protein